MKTEDIGLHRYFTVQTVAFFPITKDIIHFIMCSPKIRMQYLESTALAQIFSHNYNEHKNQQYICNETLFY